eukprot:Em0009g113a
MSTKQLAIPQVCGICAESFTDPRTLSCLHSFCRVCLEKELAKGPGSTVTCPTCQRRVPIAERGVAALPKNLHLAFQVEIASYGVAMETASGIKCSSCSVEGNGPSKAFCSTCCEFLCQFCWDYHRASRKLQGHETTPLCAEALEKLPTLMKRSEHCNAHRDETLKFYCPVCEDFVCQECLLMGHMDHNPIDLPSIAGDQREELAATLTSSLRSLGQIREGVVTVEARVKHMEEMRTKVTRAIKGAFEELHRALNERRGQLLERTESLIDSKVASLCSQKEGLQRAELGLAASCEMASQVLQTHTDYELVALKRLLPLEMRSLVDSVSLHDLRLQSDVIFNVDSGSLAECIARFGIVDNCCPAQSSWAQTRTSPPTVHSPYHLVLQSRDSRGEGVTRGGLEVRAELRPTMEDQPCTVGEVEDQGDGTYTITLTPLTTGRHQLCVTIHGHHALNSPCDLIVLNAGREYGKLETAVAVVLVVAPYNVAVDTSGDLYVSGGSNCIRVFDAAGHNTFTVGGGGSGDGHFYNPRGIAIRGDRLYVADDSNNRVQEMTKGGEFVRKFGQMGPGPSCFNGVMDVCVDAAGKMYVADYNNHRIQVFNGDGSSSYSIGGNTSGSGAFSFPWGVALDPHRNIHVVAWGTESVKVFSSGGPAGPGGTFIRMYGSLNHPTGIAIDNAGISFVTDYGTNSLCIFDAQGNTLHMIRRLNRPYGVAVDRNGFVYVANSGTNQVLRY